MKIIRTSVFAMLAMCMSLFVGAEALAAANSATPINTFGQSASATYNTEIEVWNYSDYNIYVRVPAIMGASQYVIPTGHGYSFKTVKKLEGATVYAAYDFAPANEYYTFVYNNHYLKIYNPRSNSALLHSESAALR